MNTANRIPSIRGGNSQVRADAEIRGLLELLAGESGVEAADIRLARAVWSRITEPGDQVAGTVIALLGALPALDLVTSNLEAREVERVLRDADREESPSSRKLAAALARWRPRLDRAGTVLDFESAVKMGMRLLTPEDSEWPAGLNDLGHHAPHALWVRGAPKLLNAPSLAVVGARACSGYGTHVTAEFTNDACSAGYTIVSGAAYGVDAVAHRTALTLERPTVAVLAGGADRPYPAAHSELIARIAKEGVVCSEMIPGSAPTRWRFLQRNRIIAALAQAVLVTEAGVRSGTLNTAGHAAELGRALGAVPGAITSAASAGCHRLIRDYGAALITNEAELLELLGSSLDDALFSLSDESTGAAPRTPSLHLRLLDALPLTGALAFADIALRAGVSSQEASEALTELELLRYVARHESADRESQMWTLLRRS